MNEGEDEEAAEGFANRGQPSSSKDSVAAAAQRVHNRRIYPVARNHRKSHVRHRGVPLLADCSSRIIGVRLWSCER